MTQTDEPVKTFECLHCEHTSETDMDRCTQCGSEAVSCFYYPRLEPEDV